MASSGYYPVVPTRTPSLLRNAAPYDEHHGLLQLSLLSNADGAFTQTPEEFVGAELLSIIEGYQEAYGTLPMGLHTGFRGGYFPYQTGFPYGWTEYWNLPAGVVQETVLGGAEGAATAAEELEAAALTAAEENHRNGEAAVVSYDTPNLLFLAAEATRGASPRDYARAERAGGAAPVTGDEGDEVLAGRRFCEPACSAVGEGEHGGGPDTAGDDDDDDLCNDAGLELVSVGVAKEMSLKKLGRGINNAGKSAKAAYLSPSTAWTTTSGSGPGGRRIKAANAARRRRGGGWRG